MNIKLDDEEREILEMVEKDQLVRVENFDEESDRLRQAAINTLKQRAQVDVGMPTST